MSNTNEVIKKLPEAINNHENEASLQPYHPSKDDELVCKWWDRMQEADNGLGVSIFGRTDVIGSIKFELKCKPEKEQDYDKLLRAKIFETFGVYNPGVAAAAFTECITCIPFDTAIKRKELDKTKAFLEKHFENVLSLFQEMRPRDSIELMLVTKMIILNYLSNCEFTGSATTSCEDRKTTKQVRGIKLARLFLEFKDKFDKHRKPEQQIYVQHNHIHKEGQAVIGSQISTGGGKIF